MTVKNILSYCRQCGSETNHTILKEITKTFHEEYECNIEWQIIECCGCETISFRHVFHDLEHMYEIENYEYVVPEEINIYPRSIKGHQELSGSYYLPKIVKTIYTEVLQAISEDIKILAGLGLRSAVEAVCNDLEIKGNLDKKITKLATMGYISKKESSMLHAIRFMGNDAAHEIKIPEVESIQIALQIIEHLLLTVYILEKKAEGELEIPISKYDDFTKLLKVNLKKYKSGDEFPLAEYFGRDFRRVKDEISKFENKLINEINNGDYKQLKIGKIVKVKKSKKTIQHFIVV